ncbi:MAG: hypothetical protein AAF599_01790 [Bacteroidota bacterium]
MKQTLPHVILLGCGRSGTSIFGELFDHFPDYQYYSEPSYEIIKDLDFTIPTAIKVPKSHPEFSPTTGLSFPLDDLIKTINQPIKWYWQVRHPLDTICSLRVGIAKNWGHHPRPEDWKEWLNRPLLEQCAHHWNYINTFSYAAVKDLVQIKHFEQMIDDAYTFAVQIAQEIGVDVSKNKAVLQTWANRVQNTNNEQFVEAKTSRAYSTKDHQVRVERWRENLSKGEVAQLIPMVRETAEDFGYKF